MDDAGDIAADHAALSPAPRPKQNQLIANLTHELKTPLHAILTVANLLAEEVDGTLNNEQKKQVAIIQRNGDALLALITDLLTFTASTAAERSLRVRRLNPILLLHEMLDNMAPIALQKKIQLDTKLVPFSGQYASDKILLGRIFGNLLSNALKFSSENSTISIDAWIDSQTALHLQIADSGVGMNRATREQVFEEFYQADSDDNRSFGGVGLGLTLVKNAVLKLSGTIELHSEAAQGTLFHITLPNLADTLLEFEIAVITSDPTIRTVLSECLSHEGLTAQFFVSVAELLQQRDSRIPELILLDLPTARNSLESLSELRDFSPDKFPTTIAILGEQSATLRAKCFELGATDIIVKPFDTTELAARLFTHIGK